MSDNGINLARFIQRDRLNLECKIITPMFLGGADQNAALRSAPFKGVLRYWWRVANSHRLDMDNPSLLLEKENELFGSADEKTGGKSRIKVRVYPISELKAKKDKFINPGQVEHPELKTKTDPLNYLAGMGLIHYKDGICHSYFPTGEKFNLQLEGDQKSLQKISSALDLFIRFAAIGSRSRNGWGSFSCQGDIPNNDPPDAISWKEVLKRYDYPNALGKDDQGDLLWKTKLVAEKWEKVMKELAEVYISIRAGNKERGIDKLEVNSGRPPDRHLLGYPVTNHTKHWGKNARHASALRLFVRKDTDGYRGYILHLPHLFSKEMHFGDANRQIKIWEQVHNGLDQLCKRASYQEVKI